MVSRNSRSAISFVSAFGLMSILLAGSAASSTASPANLEPAPSTATILNTPLNGIDKKVHHLDEWRGKLRVVNFWATWCKPCRIEIPHLISVRKKWLSKNLEVIGVAIDKPDAVQDFAQKSAIDYPILLAEDEGSELMRVAGNRIGALPFTLLLDEKGKILQRHTGPLDAALLHGWLSAATEKKRR